MPSRNALGATFACLACAVVAVAPASGAVTASSAVTARSFAATCDGLPATIVGTDGADRLVGTAGDDVIAGLDGTDVIVGGGGDDTICGDAGPDELAGGPGDDRLFGGTNGLVNVFESADEPAGDALVPGPGADLVDVGVNTVLRGDGWNPPDAIDYSGSEAGVTVDLVSGVATGEGNDTVVVDQPQPRIGYVVELIGSTHADHLLGTERSDQLIGKGGGDRVDARGGDDLVLNDWDEYSPAPGEPADDVFDGGDGDDSLDSSGGDDVLLGGAGRDDLTKTRGPATLDGGPGRDRLVAQLDAGRHTVAGGDGRDEVLLSVGNTGRRARGVVDLARERFVVRLARQRPVRATLMGVERVVMPSGAGRWTYLGTAGPDRVSGSSAYTARGRGGDDVLIGSAADDVLLGGRGRDRVVGGRGEDRCRGEELVGCERPRAS